MAPRHVPHDSGNYGRFPRASLQNGVCMNPPLIALPIRRHCGWWTTPCMRLTGVLLRALTVWRLIALLDVRSALLPSFLHSGHTGLRSTRIRVRPGPRLPTTHAQSAMSVSGLWRGMRGICSMTRWSRMSMSLIRYLQPRSTDPASLSTSVYLTLLPMPWRGKGC